MIKSLLDGIEHELMEIVRLFEGAEELAILHEFSDDGWVLQNTYSTLEKKGVYSRRKIDLTSFKNPTVASAKLALYEFLSEYYRKSLPWGALTGIRPTKLAYRERARGGDFASAFRRLHVSNENIELVARTLEGQKGIYELNEDNADLYVSLPFCPTKCVYCSFVTAPIDKTRQFLPAYLQAVERELAAARPLVKNLRSVYIGGGTPFVLEPNDLERVLKAVQPFLKQGCEFTVEAGRPDVFTKEKLRLCKDYGVTRICINAQSFSDRTLQAIGRKHTARQVKEAFETAAPYGFVINCDLIAGLTGESKEEFFGSIEEAVALSPENITVHTLCLKKGAKLKEETERLSEEYLSDMIAYSRKRLSEAGYEPYYLYRQKYMAGAHENVGWTKKGCASVYNIDVMEEIASNIAVGANAIGKKVSCGGEKIERLASPKDIPTYLSKVEKMIGDRNKLFGE